jgi:undecaprenyl-diphosphatase
MDLYIIYSFQSLLGRFPILDGVGVFLAVGLIWVEAALLAAFLLFDRRRWFAVAVAGLSAVSAWSINQAIGELWFRTRPFAALDGVREIIGKSGLEKSFPSDHAALSAAVAAAVFLVDKRWGSVFVAIAAAVALGRVYVGVHYPTDVIAGASVGVGCAFLAHRLAHRYLRTRHKT